MISVEDSRRTIELSDRYVVLPTVADWGFTAPSGTPVVEGFSYTSDNNSQWLSVEDLRSLVQVE
jgi:UDP-N-acetylglucosamine 4,6-dehydratase